MKPALALPLAATLLFSLACRAGEELVTSAHYASGEPIPYILNSAGPAPKYLLILFPGGAGRVDPRLENGQLIYNARGNFLVRSRSLMVDEQFATVTTNTTQSEERVQALLDDLGKRFPQAKIYLVGTSMGTYATMRLAGFLSGKIAGHIHTSSINDVARFDPRLYKSRQLLVHHRQDACFLTQFDKAQASHERNGTEFIAMDGGVSAGDACEAYSHHGYNGIERETVDAIKKWILQGG